MAWTAPTGSDFSVGEVVTASKLNTYLMSNLRYIKGTDGPVAFENRITTPATTQTSGAGWRAVGASSVEVANLQGYDSGGVSALFFGTNRQFDGSAWQQLNTRAAGKYQITNDTHQWARFAASSNTELVEMTLDNAGKLGIGTASPGGPLHVVGPSNGGFVSFDSSAVAGSAVPVLAAGGMQKVGLLLATAIDTTNAVTGSAAGTFLAVPAAGNNDYNIVNAGADIMVLRVASTGAVSLIRTGGTKTYRVSILVLFW